MLQSKIDSLTEEVRSLHIQLDGKVTVMTDFCAGFITLRTPLKRDLSVEGEKKQYPRALRGEIEYLHVCWEVVQQ